MAINYNTNIVRGGLVLNLDTANLKSNKGHRTIINWNNWTVGTGSVTGYPASGDGNSNSRILDTNPFGNQDVIWDISNQDAASDADGGWEGSSFPIDSSKMYRFSVWVRRKTIGNGHFYLGPHSNWALTPGAYILNRSDSAQNTNPYFVASNWWGNANQWYLIVGHVWPAGSGSGSSRADSACYDTSGNKIFSINDFMWDYPNTTSFHRCYLSYSTDTATNQQMYQPRVDVVDGSEPTIAELLADAGNRLYDLTNVGNHGRIFGNPVYDSQFGGSFTFDASNDAILIPENSALNTQSPSVEVWIKTSAVTQNGFWFEKGNVNSQYSLFQEGSTIVWRQNFTTGYTNLTASSTTHLNTTQWHHVVGTFTSGNRRLYVNGALVNSDTASGYITTNANGCSIGVYGGFNGARGYWYNGSIAVVRVYNRQLSDAEVLQNYNALKGRFGR